MSDVSSIGSSPGSGSPADNLSAVGASLLANGAAPNATPPASGAPPTTTSSYQAEFLTLQQQDTAELLYASFLSPSESLANADAVLGQAAQLLGTPGSLPSPAPSGSSAGAAPSTSGATPPVVPTDASVLAASDAAAQKALSAYSNAPSGASILDYQA